MSEVIADGPGLGGRQITFSRIEKGRFRATNARGGTLDFASGENTKVPKNFPADVLVYAGAIDNDNSPKGEKRGTPQYVNYVTQAVNAARSGETVTPSETKPYGCSVKYAG